MTTLLPTQDLAILRAIARTAAVLLVAVRINQLHPGRAIADWEIADILEQDKRTVQKQLRSLSVAGLMLEQRPNWYVVTTAGQNTLFGWAEAQIPEKASLSIEETPIPSDAQNVHAQNVQFMNDDDDDDIKNLKHDSSSSITHERTKCAQILEATSVLFGEEAGSVSANCLGSDQKPKPTWVLAWVNKGWRDRERLSNPHGLIYRRIEARERPPRWLEQDPAAGLPDEYLDAIGMFEKRCPRCQEPFTSLAEHTTHVDACLMTHFEEPETELVAGPDETVTEQITKAWQSVLENLRKELPKAQFQTWVEDAQPVHFDGKLLQVGTRNGYARDWLIKNIQPQAGPLLSKALSATVGLEFVSVETGG